MICNSFYKKHNQYRNFELWKADDLKEFLTAHQFMEQVLRETFGMKPEDPIGETADKEELIALIRRTLDQFGDKHFLPFQVGDESFMDLCRLVKEEKMNFGISLENLNPKPVYILEMDLSDNPADFDNI